MSGRLQARPARTAHRAAPRLAAIAGAVAAAVMVATPALAATTPKPAPGLVPGAASYGGGAVTPRADVFYQQLNHRLVAKTGGAPVDLGGALTSGPAGIAQAAGEFVDESVYARGTDNAIWYRQFSDGQGAWLGWRSLGGRALGAPGVNCVGNGSAPPIVYVRGGDQAIWRNPGAGWSRISGAVLSDPAGIGSTAGACAPTEDVFALATNQTVVERLGTTWRTVGGRSTVAPAAIRLRSGETDVFARGTDNAAWMATRPAGSSTWSGFHRVGGQFTSPLTAVVDPRTPNARVIMGLGTDGNLWQLRNVIGTTTWSGTQVP